MWSLTPMSERARLFGYLVLILLCLGPGGSQPAAAADKPVTVYLFWTEGCPHCLHEKEFLAALERRNQGVKVVALEVSARRENLELLQKVGELLQANVTGVPFTVIGDHYLIGWQDEPTTGRAIEAAIREAQRPAAPDLVAGLLTAPGPVPPHHPEKLSVPETLTLPVFGQINLKYLSLAAITVIIGGLDGFNPCAMWVLIFLINLLLRLEDRKKMWTLGTAFILASGAVYFLFMTAWLNILIFLGFIFWIRIIIGCVALLAGGYNLKEYWTDTAGACTLSHGARRQKTMDRLKETVTKSNFWLALAGIVLLAFLVNLVELICSAGFPVVYLQILSLTPMPFWQYYLYLLLYITIFMLDDIIVFVVAMLTLQLAGATTRYKRLANLIGGILMLLIGVLLIFKPGWLMFG
jgi:thiol-disulfide isomerase/thioredoxin